MLNFGVWLSLGGARRRSRIFSLRPKASRERGEGILLPLSFSLSLSVFLDLVLFFSLFFLSHMCGGGEGRGHFFLFLTAYFSFPPPPPFDQYRNKKSLFFRGFSNLRRQKHKQKNFLLFKLRRCSGSFVQFIGIKRQKILLFIG